MIYQWVAVMPSSMETYHELAATSKCPGIGQELLYSVGSIEWAQTCAA